MAIPMKPETAPNIATALPVDGGETSLPSEVLVGGEGMFGPESTETRDKLWTELDANGESKVRVRLAMSYYGEVGARRALVLEWLRTRVKNETVDVRAAAAAAAAERHARVAARRTKEAKRAKRRTTIALIFATLSAMGVFVLVVLSLAE